MKKWQKISLVSLAVVAVVFLLANLGLNFWLKYSLPTYIKENSHYKVSYKSLNVELITGSISASEIAVASKNPNDPNVIGIDGNVQSLKVSRLGIWDALVNKKINSSNITLVKPKLKITLAKPIDDRTGKKRNPVGFENITIQEGNITLFRHTKQKFLDVKNLELNVSNLKMTEESVEDKLPVVFDDYSIKGDRFYFRPDNVYAMKAEKINTENGQMSVKNFQLIPLLTYAQFTKFYPKKRNLFSFQTKEMDFKDIVLKNNRISLSNMKFTEPVLKMFTTNVKPEEKQKSFKYEVNLEDVKMSKAQVQILKPNGTTLFSSADLNLNINKMVMDEETAKGNIPFSYEKFLISGKDVQYISETQNVALQAFAVNQNSLNLQKIVLKPTVSTSSKTLADVSADKIAMKINEWKFINNKLKLNAENAFIKGLSGNIITPENPQKKSNNFDKIVFPLTVKNIQVLSPNFSMGKASGSRTFQNLVLKVENFEINEATAKQKVPFKTGKFSVTTRNFSHRVNQFYTMNAGLVKMNNGSLQINNFSLKPSVSRSQFIKMIPTERDLYTVSISQINAKGDWGLLSDEKHLYAPQVTVNNMYANVFRSKIPADNPAVKPFFSEHLRKIKFPMIIQNLDIKNSVFEYEEDSKESIGSGKLTFGNFNANIKNINSGKSAGKPTQISIAIRSLFMNASPLLVNWNLDTAKKNDAFTISGNVSNLPASRINPFIEPYLKVKATSGDIQQLFFDFKGTAAGLNGIFKMKHKDLKIALLNETGEKKKVLTAIANMLVKTDSGHFPESVSVDDVKRDYSKSFFNLFWKGLQEGLKKTLIGKNIEKTEATVKNTVKDTKATVKDATTALKTATEKVKTTVDKAVPADDKPKKEGFFKRVFKKREKPEN